MKKKFLKWAYLSALLLVFVLVFVFSVTATADGGDNYKEANDFDAERAYGHIKQTAQKERPRGSAAHEDALNYIIEELVSYGVTPVVMDYAQGYKGGSVLVPNTRVRNILVEFKGTETGDVLLFQAHTDSVPMGPGASDDMMPVAAMIELVRQIKTQKLTFKNTVVFLFTDGEEEGLYGAYKYANKEKTTFIGNAQVGALQPVADRNEIVRLENLADKTKFVLNFEMRGTGGRIVMFETTKGNYNSVANFAKINKNVYTNSVANFIYSMMPNGTDFSALSNNGVQGLNFASIGEGYNYHTQGDNIKNAKISILAQFGAVMQDSLNYFGDMQLSKMYESKDNAVFFSVLDIFTVVYPSAVVIVFSILTLLLIAGAAIINRRFKKYSYKKFLLALSANLIALGAAVLASFLFKLVFGAFPLLGQLLNSSSFNAYAPVFGYLLLMTGVFVLIQSLFNKLFKNNDASEYNSLAHGFFIGVVGAVVSFILPEISILLSPAGFIAAIVLAVSAAVPNFKFKKLYLGFIPCIVMLPIMLSFMLLAADALGLTLGFITPVLGILALGFILPYLSDAGAFFAAKIPVNETADKGIKKFAKTAGRKSNSVTAGVLVITGIILLLTLAAFPLSISTNTYGKAGQSMAMVDDAVIYRTELDGTDGKFYIFDRSTYEYLNKHYGLKGVYDSSLGGYLLDLTGSVTVAAPQIISQKQDSYFELDIKKTYENGRFELYIPFDSDADTSITKIVITDKNGTYEFTKDDFFNGMKGGKSIVFRSYSDSVVRIYTAAQSLDFTYVEEAFTPLNVTKINDIKDSETSLRTGVRIVKEYRIEP